MMAARITLDNKGRCPADEREADVSKHTPGPWRVQKFSDTKSWTLYGSGSVASIGNIKHEANARLIAAAPTMLEALKVVAAQFTTIDNICNEEACEAVRAAIAEADGA